MSYRVLALVRGAGLALTALALLAFLGYFVVYSYYAYTLFRFPYDYDQGEGFELYDSVLFSQGEWPYRDNAVYPFYASNYPPVFHLIVVPLVWAFGPQLWTGRVVSFAATLVIAALIVYAVRRETRLWAIPVLSGLAFLASNYVYQIGPLFRSHMTMVLFETAAVLVLNGVDDPRYGRRNLLAGLMLLLTAGYTKPQAVVTVIAAFLFLFLRGPRRALVAGVAFATITGLIFWAIDRATAGQWTVNVIQANVNAYDAHQAAELYFQWFRLHAVLILLAAGYVIYELFWSRLSAYSLWFVLAIAGGVLSGKWGASAAYFTTSVAAMCLVSGLAAGKLAIVSRATPAVKHPGAVPIASYAALALTLLVPLLYLHQAARVFHMPTRPEPFTTMARLLGQPTDVAYLDALGFPALGRPPTEEDSAAGRRIAAYVAAAPGPALSEEAGFPLSVGKPVVTNPTQLLNLDKNGLLDKTQLLAAINAQRFGVVVLRAQFYPQDVLDAIGQAYELVEEIRMNGFTYRILKPRSRL
uniref:Glycosyltransferase RgtA/B/C/D-like domain-containing protein n=1 Tax=uncultured prokaryote TaxID=198431 RepID=H5SKS1_9ZZZZ|nr:hypothetical protein HGMM_F42G03C20 [uncultured prokaryote]